MKKLILPILIASFLSLPALAKDVGHGFDVSANAALSTDYIWRGYSQTGGHPAISGGFDVAHSSGLYIGTWGSNVDFDDSTSLELDAYGGVSNELFNSGVSYDVGAIGYIYPGEDYDFYEIYAGLSAEIDRFAPSAKVYYDPDNQNTYVDGTIDVSLPAEFTVTGHYGAYLYDDRDDHVNDYLVGVSRPVFGLDLGLAYTYSDGYAEDDKGRVVLSVSKAF